MLFGLKENERSGKGLWLLLGVFVGTIILGAIFSPPLYLLVQWLAQGATEDTFWGYLAHHKYPRYFDRVRILGVVISLIWLLRYCKLWSWYALGFRREHLRHVPKWFAYGLLMMLLAAGCQWLVGQPYLKEGTTVAKVVEKIVIMTFSGLFLAIIEESIFRGMVFRIFYTACNRWVAVVLASLFFAYVHFKHVPWEQGQALTFSSGFYVAWMTLLSPLYTFDFFTFVNLFLAGVILNLIFLRTKSLWCCVGMHAGWVALKVPYGKFVRMPEDFPQLWWGSHQIIDGILPIVMLLVVAWMVTLAKPLKA